MQNYIIRVMRQQQFHLKFLAYLKVGNFQGPTQVIIGVGEITGVPLEVIPSSDWGWRI